LAWPKIRRGFDDLSLDAEREVRRAARFRLNHDRYTDSFQRHNGLRRSSD
jgi:hypothetical protein